MDASGPTTAQGVAGDGNLVVVAFDGALGLIEVSTLDEIEPLGGVPTDFAQSIVIDLPLGYVADTNGLKVADLTDPVAPRVIGSLSVPARARAGCLALSGHLALIEDFDTPGGPGAGLMVIHVSDPMAPAPVGTIYSGGGEDVAANGSYAFVAGGLKTIDISDPSAPRLVGQASVFYGAARRITLFGTLAYVISVGHQIFDISHPEEPIRLGRVAGNSAQAISVDDQLTVVAACVDGIKVYAAHCASTTAITEMNQGRGHRPFVSLVASPNPACSGVALQFELREERTV